MRLSGATPSDHFPLLHSAVPSPKLRALGVEWGAKPHLERTIAMPLMTTKPMFDLAYNGGFAVGAFNVNNMEITQAIVDACAAEKSPVILQISKGARKYANMRYLKHMIDAAVEEHPELPIAIHLDHGDTVELVKTCI